MKEKKKRLSRWHYLTPEQKKLDAKVNNKWKRDRLRKKRAAAGLNPEPHKADKRKKIQFKEKEYLWIVNEVDLTEHIQYLCIYEVDNPTVIFNKTPYDLFYDITESDIIDILTEIDLENNQ